MFKNFYEKHIKGENGIAEVFQVAWPIIVSNSSDSIMMFTDRLLLTVLGKEYPAASLSGGFTAFFCWTFFAGLVGYSTALVGQNFGAKRKGDCSKTITQGVIICLVAYPLILIVGNFLGPLIFQMAGHGLKELQLELAYFKIILFGSLFSLIKIVFTGFYAGIGRTSLVMRSNVLGMIINIPLTYVLIHGHYGFPKLGLYGAAYATLASFVVVDISFVLSYFSRRNREEFELKKSLAFDLGLIKKYFRFGTANGLEFSLTFFALVSFVNLFQSYGPDEAAAMTITFNWDVLVFLPLLGINLALMGLVGKNMGASEVEKAKEVTYSALKLSLFLMILVCLLFWIFTPFFVEFFIPDLPDINFSGVISLGIPMLKLAGIYLISDAITQVMAAALRGAGDTKWCMWTSISIFWTMLVVTYFSIKKLHAPPIMVWGIFVIALYVRSFAFSWRFKQGKWQTIKVI